jgi:glycosyltransferase involved in cell wall biosynthesis
MKMVKILHYSPHDENDGIAKYQEQYLNAMEKLDDVENKFFDVSPHAFRHLSPDQKHDVLKRLHDELKQYDVFHIQHEFGLFDELDFLQVFNAAHGTKAKVVVSVHLSPGFAIKPVRRGGLSPRNTVKFLRAKRHRKRMIERHIQPMLEADLLLVHNDITADALVDFGADRSKIKKIVHPVYEWPEPEKTTVIKNALSYKPGDVIYCTVGMLHRYKGIFDAVKALKFLPNNYKLAILGGMHPLSDEVAIYNRICDTIDKIGVRDRVYITGFVRDDHELNSYIRECDISVFPYDGMYYGHLSSGSINLGLANDMPVIAYPTKGFKELAESADGAVVLTQTFAYYELAREIQRIDAPRQRELSRSYAHKMSWPKNAAVLADAYQKLVATEQ